MNRDPLDERLRSWAARRAPTASHLDALARRIHAAAAHLTPACRAVASRRRDTRHLTPFPHPFALRFAYGLAGIAVGVALTLAFLRATPLTPGPRDDGNATRLAGISSGQIRVHKRLFQEMNRLFAERLRWVAETDGKMAMGVEALSGAANNAAPVLVRLTVLERRENGPWIPAWNTDVLVRGEEMVEVAPDRKTDDRIVLWVYPLSDGRGHRPVAPGAGRALVENQHRGGRRQADGIDVAANEGE